MRLGILLTVIAAAWAPTSFAAMYVCVGENGARTVQDHACNGNEQQKKPESLHRPPVAGVVYAHWSHDLLLSSVNPESLQMDAVHPSTR